jgi:hypothetical protein
MHIFSTHCGIKYKKKTVIIRAPVIVTQDFKIFFMQFLSFIIIFISFLIDFSKTMVFESKNTIGVDNRFFEDYTVRTFCCFRFRTRTDVRRTRTDLPIYGLYVYFTFKWEPWLPRNFQFVPSKIFSIYNLLVTIIKLT